MKNARPILVAAIHTHFNINRNVNEAHEGEVTLEEQLKALVRFVRWHERQVVVGRKLLNRLLASAPPIISSNAPVEISPTPTTPA